MEHNNEFTGSTEKALQSKQKIDVNKVLQEAYETTKQKRTAIAGGIVWSGFILFAAMLLVMALANAMGIEEESRSAILISYAVQIIIFAPLMAGIYLMALRNVLGGKANVNEAFAFLSKPWPIMAVALITTVIGQGPAMLGIENAATYLWAFFFQITFALAIIITASGQATPLNSVLLSFNVVIKRFLGFLVLNLVIFIVTMLIAVPVIILGVFAQLNSIAMIFAVLAGVAAIYLVFAWVIPTYFHAIAIYYRDLFAVTSVSADNKSQSYVANSDDSFADESEQSSTERHELNEDGSNNEADATSQKNSDSESDSFKA
ncbi:hypothetical protein CWE08_04105 [Aliidiomarina iranensis]|uniref:Uncharacterized protein n=1 Tax=Aliidiomarina iranensis TaxID=1434071 RepID=A0A432W069_9GAMM|nr:hypothetical protein [Aliidiomarina iranensis]RUO22372.1 hypothetical protein CWE08_04105 [Aliidiomarina iranensis]